MRKNKLAVFGSGAIIGTLGGLIGLGGAEFRLPLLIGIFNFAALEAVIMNKATSLVVVSSAFIFRTRTIPFDNVMNHWLVIVNLLLGSLIGAWLGAGWAIRLKSKTLYRIIALLLLAIAVVLLFSHQAIINTELLFTGLWQSVLGVIAGFGIGVIASLLGVAGGEFLIPTLVLLYGLDIKLAGSLSLAISLPTMLTGFMRYSRDNSFAVLSQNYPFVLLIATGSLVGTFLGGLLLGLVSDAVLLPILAGILVISAVKVWKHG
jgi:uncharacterized membrane protein YfcA